MMITMTTAMTTRNMMTINNRPKDSHLILKGALVAGSLAASLLGTRLLAQKDAAAQNAATILPTPIVVTVYVPVPAPSNQPHNPAPASVQGQPVAPSNLNPNQLLSNLAPIPQAISPVIQPVARTQSSK